MSYFGIPSLFHHSASALPVETVTEEPPMTFEHLYTTARQEEQHAHFTAIANAMESRKAVHAISSLANATASITTETIITEKHNRLYRLICRLGALDPAFPQDSLFQKAEQASQSQQPIEVMCTTLGITLLPSSRHLIATFREQEQKIAALETISSLTTEKATLMAALFSLEQLLFLPPQETERLEDRNRDILITLRAIY